MIDLQTIYKNIRLIKFICIFILVLIYIFFVNYKQEKVHPVTNNNIYKIITEVKSIKKYIILENTKQQQNAEKHLKEITKLINVHDKNISSKIDNIKNGDHKYSLTLSEDEASTLQKLLGSVADLITISKALEENPEYFKLLPRNPPQTLNQKLIILFDRSSTKLTVSAQQKISGIAAQIKSSGISNVCIIGYADKTGNLINNKKLSRNRAEVVADKLRKHSLSSITISIIGRGEVNIPILTPNNISEPRNRSAEIQLNKCE